MEHEIERTLRALKDVPDEEAAVRLDRLLASLIEKRSEDLTSAPVDGFVRVAEAAFVRGYLDMVQQCLKVYFRTEPPASDLHLSVLVLYARSLKPRTAQDVNILQEALSIFAKIVEMATSLSVRHDLIAVAGHLFCTCTYPFQVPDHQEVLVLGATAVLNALERCKDDARFYTPYLAVGFILLAAHLAKRSEKSREKEAGSLAKKLFEAARRHDRWDDMARILFFEVRNDVVKKSTVSEQCGKSSYLLFHIHLARCMRYHSKNEKPDGSLSQAVAALYSSTPHMHVHVDEIFADSRKHLNMAARDRFDALTDDQRQRLLLRYGEVTFMQGLTKDASKCYTAARSEESNMSPENDLRLEVLYIRTQQSKLSINCSVEEHIDIVKAASNLIATGKIKSADLLEVMGHVIWDSCKPIIIASKRASIRVPLAVTANALEKVNSNKTVLRCNLHMEAALCAEQVDLSLAAWHWQKASMVDLTGYNRSIIEHNASRVSLLVDRFKPKENLMDRLIVNLEKLNNPKVGGLRPNEMAEELVRDSICILAGPGYTLDEWLPPALTRSVNRGLVGAGQYRGLKAMQSVSVTRAGGSERISMVQVDLIKQRLLASATRHRQHRAARWALDEAVASTSTGETTSLDVIRRTRLWCDLYELLEDNVQYATAKRLVGRFAERCINNTLFAVMAEAEAEAEVDDTRERSSDDSDDGCKCPDTAAVSDYYRYLLLNFTRSMLHHLQALITDLKEEGVGVFQVPVQPSAVKLLIAKDLAAAIDVEKETMRQEQEAAEEVLRSERQAAEHAAEEARQAAVEEEKEDAEHREFLASRTLASPPPPKAARAGVPEVSATARQPPIEPALVIAPDREQELLEGLEQYMLWQEYVEYIKSLNSEIFRTLMKCIEISFWLGDVTLLHHCVLGVVEHLAAHLNTHYDNCAVLDPNCRKLAEMIPSLTAVGHYSTKILCKLLAWPGEKVIVPEMAARLCELVLLGNLVQCTPTVRPPPPPPTPADSGKKKPAKKKAGKAAAAASRPASPVNTTELVVDPQHADRLSETMELCRQVMCSPVLEPYAIDLPTQNRLMELRGHVAQLLVQLGAAKDSENLPSAMSGAFTRDLCQVFSKVAMLHMNLAPLEKKMPSSEPEQVVDRLRQLMPVATHPVVYIRMLYKIMEVVAPNQAKQKMLPDLLRMAVEAQLPLTEENVERLTKPQIEALMNMAWLVGRMHLVLAKKLLERGTACLSDPDRPPEEKLSVLNGIAKEFHAAAKNAYNARDFRTLMTVTKLFFCEPIRNLVSGKDFHVYKIAMSILSKMSVWITNLSQRRDRSDEDTVETAFVPATQPQQPPGELGSEPNKEAAPPPVTMTTKQADLMVRAALFEVELKWLLHKEQYQEGAKLAEQAIRQIPQEYHRSFDVYRLQFKMNCPDFNDADIDGIENPEDRYTLLLLVTNRTVDARRCGRAFEKMTEALRILNDPMRLVHLLLTRARWQFENDFQREYTMELIEEAISLVSTMPPVEEPFPVEDDDEPPEEEEATVLAPSRKTSEVGSRQSRAKSSKGRPATASIPTKPDFTIQTAENGIVSAEMLDSLAEAHSLLARIHKSCDATAAGVAKTKENAMVAADLYYRMWNIAKQQVELKIAYDAYLKNSKTDEPTKKDGKKDKGNKEQAKNNKKKPQPPTPDPTEQQEGFPLPSTPAGWCVYTVPQQAVACMIEDARFPGAINRYTIKDVPRTLESLSFVAECLEAAGVLPLATPLLALEQYISSNVQHLPDYSTYTRIRLLDTACKLELGTVKSDLMAEGFPLNIRMDEVDSLRLGDFANKQLSADGDISVSAIPPAMMVYRWWAETGRILVNMACPHKAIELASAAEKFASDLKDYEVMSLVSFVLARAYFQLKSFQDAYYYLFQAASTAPSSTAIMSDILTFFIESVCVQPCQEDMNKKLACTKLLSHMASKYEADKITTERLNFAFKKNLAVVMLRRLQTRLSALHVENHPHPSPLDIQDIQPLKATFLELGLLTEAMECFDLEMVIWQKMGTIGDVDGRICAMEGYTSCQGAVTILSQHRDHAVDEIKSIPIVSGPGSYYTLECERRYAKTLYALRDVLMPVATEYINDRRKDYARWYALTEMEKRIETYCDDTENEEQENADSDGVVAQYDCFRTSVIERSLAAIDDATRHIPEDSSVCTMLTEWRGQLFYQLAERGFPSPLNVLHQQFIAEYDALLAERAEEEATDEEPSSASDETQDSPPSADMSPEDDSDSADGSEEAVTVQGVSEGIEMLRQYQSDEDRLTESCKCFETVISRAVKDRYWLLAAQGYWELLHAYYHSNKYVAVHYLVAHQSCRAMEGLTYLLESTCSKYSSMDKNALAWCLWYKRLTSEYNGTSGYIAAHTGRVPEHYRGVNAEADAFLGEQQVYQSLSLSKDPLWQIMDFPPDFTFVIMQHNPDRSQLYTAVVHAGMTIRDADKEPEVDVKATGRKAKVEPKPSFPEIAIQCEDVNVADIVNLRDRWLHLFTRVSGQQMSNEQALRGEETCSGIHLLSDPDFQSEFALIKQGMENYIAQNFAAMDTALGCLHLPTPAPSSASTPQPPTTPGGSPAKKQNKTPKTAEKSPGKGDKAGKSPEKTKSGKKSAAAGATAERQGRYVVLLVDEDLVDLPWEATSYLRANGIDGISRDFSVNSLHQRMMRVCPPPATPVAPEEDSKPKKKAESTRDPKEKPPQYESTGNPIINTTNFHYVIDPTGHLPTGETSPHVTAAKLAQVVSDCGAVTSKWTAHLPPIANEATESFSSDDWDDLALAGSGFLYYGCGPLHNQYTFGAVMRHNLTACQIAFIMDSVETKKSLKGLKWRDIAHRCANDTVAYVGLLSLAGVSSVFETALPCSPEHNAELVTRLIQGLCVPGSKSVGQVVQEIRATMAVDVADQAEDATEQATDEAKRVTSQLRITLDDTAPEVHPVDGSTDQSRSSDAEYDTTLIDGRQKTVETLRAHSSVTDSVQLKMFSHRLWGHPHLAFSLKVGQKSSKGK